MSSTVAARSRGGVLQQFWTRATAPVDGAGFDAFGRLLGVVLCFAIARFALNGWIDQLLVAPEFHFKYYGFSWLPDPSGAALRVAFGAMFCAALAMALGVWRQLAALTFCMLFTYCELVDQTLYLNHYYLVSLLTAVLALLPLWRSATTSRATCTAAWVYWALRVQVGIVYFYAGLAKLDWDWLVRAEPLATWLAAFADLPVVGPLFDQRPTAYAMSWFGAAFDLSVPFLLCVRRTRPWAYALLVAFHAVIWLLFPVGIFSWVMVAAASIFFEPGWPERLISKLPLGVGLRVPRATSRDTQGQACALPGTQKRVALLVGVHLAIQSLLPLRHLVYPGDVNWTNEGFRFAWRVMLVEKTGHVEFVVRHGDAVERVYPERELTRLQFSQMSIQPDMIHQYARHVAARYRARGEAPVEVRADAWAQLNGKPMQRLIDPDVDLATQPWSLWPAPWIVALNPEPADRD